MWEDGRGLGRERREGLQAPDILSVEPGFPHLCSRTWTRVWERTGFILLLT